jgi:hypothetical protein
VTFEGAHGFFACRGDRAYLARIRPGELADGLAGVLPGRGGAF